MIIRFLAALSLAIPLATLSASLATAQSANQMPGMDADMPLAGGPNLRQKSWLIRLCPNR